MHEEETLDSQFTQPTLTLDDIVEVTWADAHSSLPWEYLSEIIKTQPKQTKSVGYLAVADKTRVIIVQTLDGQAQGADYLTIPRGMVTKIRYLKRAKKPKREESETL